jgi:hypothetical protein
MATFLPRRDRMLAVRVRKRGWVFIISSGTKKERAAGPGGSKGGSVKFLQPRRGKEVNVIGISVSFICPCAITRLQVSTGHEIVLPSFHVPFYFEKVFEIMSVWFSWSGFKHVPSILWMKSGNILFRTANQPAINDCGLPDCMLQSRNSSTRFLQLLIIGKFFQDLILSQ